MKLIIHSTSLCLHYHSIIVISPTSNSTLFPYTTLFRSVQNIVLRRGKIIRRHLRIRGDHVRSIATQLSTGILNRDAAEDRKSTRLNSSHRCISYAVFCLKKKNKNNRKPWYMRLNYNYDA